MKKRKDFTLPKFCTRYVNTLHTLFKDFHIKSYPSLWYDDNYDIHIVDINNNKSSLIENYGVKEPHRNKSNDLVKYDLTKVVQIKNNKQELMSINFNIGVNDIEQHEGLIMEMLQCFFSQDLETFRHTISKSKMLGEYRTTEYSITDTQPVSNDYIPQAGTDTSKLPNGGVYNSFNFAVFGYGNNNPVKYNDPTGEYAEITQEGNNIAIIILVKFKKGTTDEQKALFKSATESYWTGTYGDKNVTLIVEERKRGRKNRVRFSNREGTSYVFASYSAKIYKEDGKTEAEQKEKQKLVIAHEVGHFMYLDDMYEERKYPDGSRKTSPKETWDKNIMAEFWGKVAEKNIDDILKKNRVKIIEEQNYEKIFAAFIFYMYSYTIAIFLHNDKKI